MSFPSAWRWPDWLKTLLIVAAGCWAFRPALHGGWLMDDDTSLAGNPLMHDPAGLWKMWAPGNYYDYFPIEATVQWAQWKLWQNDTFGYHLTNLVLHLAGAMLVWRLLGKLGLRLAWLGGLLFAVHPVVVESVAWIVELKNTLSLPPFLLSMCAYIDYEERKQARDYRQAVGWFLVAMLCKVSMALFPPVILLYVWWKRGRIGWGDAKNAGPFLVISLVLGTTTFLTQKWFHHPGTVALDSLHPAGFFSRLALAGTSIAFYFLQCVWPMRILPVYPKWPIDPPTLAQFLPWPIIAGAFWWFWTKRRSWGRHALLGFGFFLINLLPFVGFIDTSYMSLAWVMDHILYIPLIGLIGLAVAAMENVDGRFPSFSRPYGAAIVAVALAMLTIESHLYAGLFVDQETLWTYTLRYNPGSYRIHNNLGIALQRAGRPAAAMREFEEASRLDPDFLEARINLGNSLLQARRPMEAIAQYRRALALKPDSVNAHINLGNALLQTGQTNEGIAQYRETLKIDPDFAEAYNNLGAILFQTGRVDEAMEEYRRALIASPDFAQAHNNLGNALLQTGRLAEAVEQYRLALQLNPDYADAHNNLGVALRQGGHADEAIEQFREAQRLKPDSVDARRNLDQLSPPPVRHAK